MWIKAGSSPGFRANTDALCDGEHYAVECYSHTTNAEFFERWFNERLVKAIPKGHTVIMDNASFHHEAKLKGLAEKAGLGYCSCPRILLI